jgi:SAM-dependent methyltransferase
MSAAVRLPPWTKHEHIARYEFVATYAQGQDVVDCASGDGSCSMLMAQAGARSVRAFDVSETAVSEAAAQNRHGSVEFAVADATALPAALGSADLFVSLETIEHLQDAHRFLAEVVRVLRPTGTFVCSTPDREVYSPGNDLSGRPWNSFHIREYSEAEFAALLSSFFAEVALFGQNSEHARVIALKCRVGKRLPGHLMIRANQVAKLPRFLYDNLERHRVESLRDGRRYEFLVAVCSGPRTSGSAE